MSGISGISALTSSSSLSSLASTLGTSSTGSTASTSGSDFANTLGNLVDSTQSLQGSANSLALKVSEGDLSSIGDAQVASTRAEVTLELMASLRNKAVDGLSQIMNMQA